MIEGFVASGSIFTGSDFGTIIHHPFVRILGFWLNSSLTHFTIGGDCGHSSESPVLFTLDHARSTLLVGILLLFTVLLAFAFGLGVDFEVYCDVSPVLYAHFVLCKAFLFIFLISFSYAPPLVAYSHLVSPRYFIASATGIPDIP